MAEPFINDTYPKTYYDTVTRLQNKDELKTKTREWLSKPRVASSRVSEILTFTFGKRSSISSISFDILSVGCRYEFTYIDSDGIELPLLRDDYNTIAFTVSSKDEWNTWQRWEFVCQPCIATKLRIRMTRVDDEKAPDGEYSIGMKNLAIKRSISSRDEAALGFKDNIDGLGNVISKTVKDWQPDKAIDDSSDTYWKSEPQISQDAVVNLYLDIRDEYAGPQYFDDIAIDPVYLGSQMNVYYSNDDTVGERLVSFDAYDYVTNMVWNDQKGYSSPKSGLSNMSFDLGKTQPDLTGSWSVYMNWWVSSISGTAGIIDGKPMEPTVYREPEFRRFDMGGNCTLVFSDITQDWTMRIDGPGSGYTEMLLHMPNSYIEYDNPQDSDKRIDTEIRVGFGVTNNDGQTASIRCRIINYWRSTGKVKSEHLLTNDIDTAKELSAISGGLPKGYTPPKGLDITGSQTKEVRIPPGSHYDIPLKDLDLELAKDICNPVSMNGDDEKTPGYNGNHLEGTLTYRTNEKYLDDAYFEIIDKSADPEHERKTWWHGEEDNSESSLVVDDKLIGTNWFWDPRFRQQGLWKPESSDGDYEASWEGIANKSSSILRKHGNLIATNIIDSPKPRAVEWEKFDHATRVLEDTDNGMRIVFGGGEDSPFGDNQINDPEFKDVDKNWSPNGSAMSVDIDSNGDNILRFRPKASGWSQLSNSGRIYAGPGDYITLSVNLQGELFDNSKYSVYLGVFDRKSGKDYRNKIDAITTDGEDYSTFIVLPDTADSTEYEIDLSINNTSGKTDGLLKIQHPMMALFDKSKIHGGRVEYRIDEEIMKGESYEISMLLSPTNGMLPSVEFQQYKNGSDSPMKSDIIFRGSYDANKTFKGLTPVAYDIDMTDDTDYAKIVIYQPYIDVRYDFLINNVFLGTFLDWRNMLNYDIYWFDGDSTFDSTISAVEGNDSLTITGRTRARNLTKPPLNIPRNERMVFSAIPEFPDDTVIYKDYGLFVYDGRTESYIAFSSDRIVSGQRLSVEFMTPNDTHLLSFGFVGTLIDGTKVKWSKPMLCSIKDRDRMSAIGIDWFDGAEYANDLVTLGRYVMDYNLNPNNDDDMDILGTPGNPTWALKRAFDGNIVYLSPGDNTYNVEDWIWAKAGQSFVFSFYTKSENGFSRPQPFLEDRDGNQFFPDRYTATKGDYDWYVIYARVSIPFGHRPDWMHFGIREKDPKAHTYIGGLHCYDNAMAFQHIEDYNRAQVSHVTDKRMDKALLENIVVRVVNASEHGSIFVPGCSVQGANRRFPEIVGTKSGFEFALGQYSNIENLVVKQVGMPDSEHDKFMQNPKRYMSPESYDKSSTLSGALVYGKFTEEPVLRGGPTDSMYMAKQWTPALIGQKLEKQTYVMPMTLKAKYIKLEFTQLTPQQYPIEGPNIRSTYRTFPVDVINEMRERSKVDNSIHNDKATVVGDLDIANIRQMVAEKFDPDAYDTPGRTTNINSSLYSNPDTEVVTGKLPTGYNPKLSGTSLYDVVQKETTSSAYYSGSGVTSNPMSSSSGNDKRTTLYQDNAEYAVYYAQYNESLISLARRFRISDWRLLYQINDYVDDTASRESIPGRLPGYWVLPGQQVRIPVEIVKQMTSTSKVDVVRRTAVTQTIDTIDDYTGSTDISKTIGPVAFDKTCVHHYQTKTEKRTQSIAYFVGIRDVKVRIVDLLSEHDNISWNFFSMDMDIWHINGGYLTSSNVFVPDFSTGKDMAVAETDMMHSQSYYRTVKLISTNRNSLMNRTYLNLKDTTAWHSAEYWDLHPELNCTWASDIPDDPRVPEDNGGAWSSIRFAWGDTWTSPITPGKHEEVWYDNELVQHIVVEPQDRRFDANGNQIPYVVELGDIYVPQISMTSLGISMYSLKPSSSVPSELETRLALVSGRFENERVIDEPIGFKSDYLLDWQNFSTSRYRLQDMQYKCKIQLSFNHFERLELYIKSPYIETGTMRVLMRNTSHANEDDWEDVTAALDEGKSIYVFKNTGHDMQIKVEELDSQDWFSSLIVIPLYIPYEDAVNYASDTIHSSYIIDDKSNGKPTGNTMRMGESRNLSVVATYENSKVVTFAGDTLKWSTSNPGIVTVNEQGVLVAHTVGRGYVRATIGSYVTPPLEIDVTI